MKMLKRMTCTVIPSDKVSIINSNSDKLLWPNPRICTHFKVPYGRKVYVHTYIHTTNDCLKYNLLLRFMLNCGKESWEKSSTTAGTLTGESTLTEELTKVSDDEGCEIPN